MDYLKKTWFFVGLFVVSFENTEWQVPPIAAVSVVFFPSIFQKNRVRGSAFQSKAIQFLLERPHQKADLKIIYTYVNADCFLNKFLFNTSTTL